MHSTSNLEDGYIGSGKRLWYSIRKHGKENHEVEILEWFPDRSSLKERERELVNEDILKDSMCMNLKVGGEGGFLNEEHQKKASSSGGKKAIQINRIVFQGKMKTDKAFMEEVIQSRKDANFVKSGSLNGWKGKQHDELTKKKIGEKTSNTQKGEKNSQYGKCWIFNNNSSIRICKSDLEKFLKEGWKKGRKMNFN
jgi:hypothetical protein